MSDQLHKELFENPGYAFKEHLEIATNDRILFSGKFGKGKTTFLKYFFDNLKEFRVNKSYFTIHISPVNYSIASNEDIIRYIKYDIILELIKNGIDFENFDPSFKETLPMYIYKNPGKVIGRLISLIPYVGKELDEVYKKGKKLIKDVEKYKKELKTLDEGNMLSTFLENEEKSESSLYENDFITKIIHKTIEDKKENNSKEALLIIDDLDRLDPEHIFRILNVFASHFDRKGSELNKFNFDKVIVVCDYNNIRNIYRNRYGLNVDFAGYIDKFYSTEPFYFQNNRELNKIIYKYIDKIKFKYGSQVFSFPQYIYQSQNRNGILPLISMLVMYDYISLRALLIYTKDKSFPLYGNAKYNGYDIDLSRSCMVIEGMIVADLIGNYKGVMDMIEDIEGKSPQIEDHSNAFKSLMIFLLYPLGNFHKDEIGKLFKLGEVQLMFDLKNRGVENLKEVTNTAHQINFIPTTIDYLNLCKIFFG
ncbi:MAG TPA: hypothetical protein DCQ97_01035, partial [Chitinophagaceae bacterium]|nr:hypothetical protein [Chitinophagaceae bacterium]